MAQRYPPPPRDSPRDLFSPLHSSNSLTSTSSPWIPYSPQSSSVLSPLEEQQHSHLATEQDNLAQHLHHLTLNPHASSYSPLPLPPSTPPPSPHFPPLPPRLPAFEAPLTPPPEHQQQRTFDRAVGAPARRAQQQQLPWRRVSARGSGSGSGGEGEAQARTGEWFVPSIRSDGYSGEGVGAGGGGGDGQSSAMRSGGSWGEVRVPQEERAPSRPAETLCTRSVLIEGVSRESSEGELREWISSRAPKAKALLTSLVPSTDSIVLRFGDARDAVACVNVMRGDGGDMGMYGSSGGWGSVKARCATRKQVEQLLDHHPSSSSILSRSEATLAITLGPSSSLSSPQHAIATLTPLLQAFGPLRSLTPFDKHLFLVEFWDEGHAETARKVLHGREVAGRKVGVSVEPSVYSTTVDSRAGPPRPSYAPPAPPPRQHSTTYPAPANPTPTLNSSRSFLPYSLEPLPYGPVGSQRSLARSGGGGQYNTAGSALVETKGEQATMGGGFGAVGRGRRAEKRYGGQQSQNDYPASYAPPRPLPPPPSNLGPQYGIIRDDKIPTANMIHFDRIEQGLDVRTTIMLKNIPNKLTDVEVMRFIEEVAGPCYDFVYVRIDWNSGLNVGYGFINFTDTRSLLRFVRARIGTRWNLCGSDKLCIASYAMIQGKASLIAHFRNSSVLDQPPSHRPKLFHSSGPLKGQPEPFPACDDPLRKARSAANASQLGLFPSNKPVFRVAEALRPLNL